MDRLDTDCLIIGGGPAGLTAAIYLARYRRNVVVVDEGESRARWIKHSYNYPGFTGGLQGEQLLQNLRDQARDFGAVLIKGKISDLQRDGDGFTAQSETHHFKAQKVLLATGVVDEKPDLPNMGEFIYEGAIRFCPVCDGYEARDKRVGVMGPLSHIIPKGLFLRTYTSDLFLLPTDHLNACDADLKSLSAAKLVLPAHCVENLRLSDAGVAVTMKNGDSVDLDILYPVMGANPRSGLAIRLGANHNDLDCLIANAHQETCVKGLYIAGDLTTDLSQIAVATGQAAIAATDMHNSLPRNFR